MFRQMLESSELGTLEPEVPAWCASQLKVGREAGCFLLLLCVAGIKAGAAAENGGINWEHLL